MTLVWKEATYFETSGMLNNISLKINEVKANRNMKELKDLSERLYYIPLSRLDIGLRILKMFSQDSKFDVTYFCMKVLPDKHNNYFKQMKRDRK